MKHYGPAVLDLIIARAKSVGDQIWYQLKQLDTLLESPAHETFDRYATICDAYCKEFDDKELGDLIATEMFLRSGKRMEASVKIANRKQADKLKEKILRRPE